MRNKTENGDNVTLQKLLDDIGAAVRDGEKLLKVGAMEAKKSAVERARSADRVIRSKPYETIGIVFGIGLIVGLMISRGFGCSTPEEE